MDNRPRALDLFSCAGGSARGLQNAGFHVTGVDIVNQPRYAGDIFICADALSCGLDVKDFAFIWASPPCLHDTLCNNRDRRNRHVSLIEPTRALLATARGGTCIENVPHAPIRPDLVLDGTMFAGIRVIRKRHFELNFPAPLALGFPSHALVSRHGWCTPTDGAQSSHTRAARARNGLPMMDSLEARRAAMGVDWPMTRHEIAQAVPPAYAEFVARAWLAQRKQTA